MSQLNTLRKHFAVGNVIFCDYWRSYDRVVAFHENNGAWLVEVQGCDSTGNVLPGIDGRVRNHCTFPDKRDVIVSTI
jgi:hypothetical protein